MELLRLVVLNPAKVLQLNKALGPVATDAQYRVFEGRGGVSALEQLDDRFEELHRERDARERKRLEAVGGAE